MIRPRQIRLKLSKSQFQHCQQLSQESARVWNTVKNFFWRTYRKKGIWLSESSMKRYIAERFSMHSQSVQAVIEKFYDNLKAARSLRCRRRRRTDASHADNPTAITVQIPLPPIAPFPKGGGGIGKGGK